MSICVLALSPVQRACAFFGASSMSRGKRVQDTHIVCCRGCDQIDCMPMHCSAMRTYFEL
jgi:hypothetical protein